MPVSSPENPVFCACARGTIVAVACVSVNVSETISRFFKNSIVLLVEVLILRTSRVWIIQRGSLSVDFWVRELVVDFFSNHCIAFKITSYAHIVVHLSVCACMVYSGVKSKRNGVNASKAEQREKVDF